MVWLKEHSYILMRVGGECSLKGSLATECRPTNRGRLAISLCIALMKTPPVESQKGATVGYLYIES